MNSSNRLTLGVASVFALLVVLYGLYSVLNAEPIQGQPAGYFQPFTNLFQLIIQYLLIILHSIHF